MFKEYFKDIDNQHRFSVPIIIYKLKSGTADLSHYIEILKLFENKKTPVFFVVTHIFEMI